MSQTDAVTAALNSALLQAKKELSEKETATVELWIDQFRTGSPDESIEALSQALSILSHSRKGRVALYRALRSASSSFDAEQWRAVAGFMVLENSQSASEYLLVCPIDPNHYRKRGLDTSRVHKCPLHAVELISEQDHA